MKILFVYITTSGPEEARKLARMIVERRLAACANILPPVESMYWWENKIQHESEAVIVAKTTEETFPDLLSQVKSAHSYSNPCIVSWPIDSGSADFLEWVRTETSQRTN